MQRSRGRILLAITFLLLSLNAFVQVLLVPLGRSDDPAALTFLQALIGAAGGAAAWGSWAGTRWAPGACVLYGLLSAALLISLQPLLDLDREARDGLWLGAALVLLFGFWAGWYLRRKLGDNGAARDAVDSRGSSG